MGYVAQRLAYEFPGRPDKQLWIGDGTPITGDCPDHYGTHNGHKSFDINYFTLAGFEQSNYLWGNATQYGSTADKRTVIWKSLDLMVLDESLIDWEKNFYFLKYMIELFPRFHCSMHGIIWGYLKSKTSMSEWQPMVKHITAADMGLAYNHHTHIHVDTESINH